MTVADLAKRAVRATPLEQPARRVHVALSRTRRRDAADNRHLAMLMAFTLRRDSCCVDVGASVGRILGEMVRLAPEGRHIAFEPIAEQVVDLRARFPHVTVHHAAVSDRAGTATFRVYPPSPQMSSLHGRPDLDPAEFRETTVPIVTLDEALEGVRPDLIKIDVEGAEGLVLRGAHATLRQRPIIWFEHSDATARTHDSSSDEVFELLTGAGMRIFDADGRGPYTLAEFRRPPRIWNFLAH
jgi:FkbM family methyltransferase